MLLEQSAKNTDVHWNAIFRKAAWYLKSLVMLVLVPWMASSILIMVGLLAEYFTGELGRNGGMTGLFQSMGLHPHTTYKTLLWIIGSGVFLAMAWLLWHTVAALFKAADRKIRKTKLGVWITRKTMSLGNTLDLFGMAHPNTLASLAIGTVIVAAFFMDMPPTPKNRMIVMPPAGMQIVQVSPYSRVLLEVPVPVRKHPNGRPIPATRTISGKAVVTQTGPQSYQVRMVP